MLRHNEKALSDLTGPTGFAACTWLVWCGNGQTAVISVTDNTC